MGVAAGRKIGLSTLLGPEREYEGDTLGEEMTFAARHPTAYERVTVVSDEDWLRPALRVLSVLVPGQLRAFPVAQPAAAREWLATAGDRGADDKGVDARDAAQGSPAVVHLCQVMHAETPRPTVTAREQPSHQGRGMAKQEKDTLYVIAAAYDDVDLAVADYEAVKELYREVRTSHDFDAAVIAKDENGKVHIVKKHEEPTRHGAAVGLSWGLAVGVAAALFPPIGIGIAAAAGARAPPSGASRGTRAAGCRGAT